jgi:hypothetical protein
MPPILNSIDKFQQLPNFSIAVTISKPKNINTLHCAIVFNLNNSIKFLHLASHCFLKLDEIGNFIDDSEKILYTNFTYLITVIRLII